jgi:hypothetical protein
MKTNRQTLLALVALTVLTVVGCGEAGPQRFNVSGTVTYNGQPVPAGVVWFDPDFSKQNDGPQGYAFIKDGKFDTAETESGPGGGPHIARVEGFDGKPGEELPMGRAIFLDFSQPVDLPREDTTLEFNVPGKS